MPTERLSPATVGDGVQALAEDYRTAISDHGVMIAQQCDECATFYFPPLLACSRCHSEKLSWVDCGPTGAVGTFVTVHAQTVTSSMAIPKWLTGRTPYSSVYVVPDAIPSIRVPALMEGPQQDALAVGSKVTFDLSEPRTPRVNIAQ